MSFKQASKKDEEDLKTYQAKKEAQVSTSSEAEPGQVNIKALQEDLKSNDIASSQFLTADEGWRKRALKFGTPESKYEGMKLKHGWLYDQPIKEKTE